MSIIILQLCEEFVIAQLATRTQRSLKNFAWETGYEKITQFPSANISYAAFLPYTQFSSTRVLFNLDSLL
jgi:hypothetical protein